MDNNYFDFLGQNSVSNNENSNTSNDTKGKVNLTVRVDADCQVICDGDFLFLANANQIVKEKAPVGQHIFNFTSLDYPDATVEKIVDFPVEGNNYLIVVNDLNEKVQQLQQNKMQQLVEIEEKKAIEEEKQREEEKLKYDRTHNVVFEVNGVSFSMIYVEGGTLVMKKKNSLKKTSVTLNGYHIGESLVTQALWVAVMGKEPTFMGGWTNEYGKGKDYPAYRISWEDIQIFIQNLNELTGKQFRLPTDAEWGYAARGGQKSRGYWFSGSDNEDEVMWYCDNSNEKCHQVKMLKPNELGIYDMSGNVYECCEDWYDDEYPYSKDHWENPTGPESGSERVIRGGSYCKHQPYGRVDERSSRIPDRGLREMGFRLALTL